MNNIEKAFEIFQGLSEEERNKFSVQIVSQMFGYFGCEKANENPLTLDYFQELIKKIGGR